MMTIRGGWFRGCMGRYAGRMLGALLGTVVACNLASAGEHEAWKPQKVVRIIVPIVGSTNDVLARLLAPELEAAFGQSFIVENKPGAGGNIGAYEVVRAEPDGHTLLVGYNGPLAINPTLFKNIQYDPLKDLRPITLFVKASQYLVAHPSMNVDTVEGFLKKVKDNPGKYSYGSVAMGSASHLTMEMLKMEAGLDITHVPYKGAAPAMVDLVAGNIQAGFFVPGNVQQYVQDGRLKLIASSGKVRMKSTPDVPTLHESGFPGFEATSWIGLLAPARTPDHIVRRYNEEVVRILKTDRMRAKLEEMEFEVVASTPEEFADWIRLETGRWGKVIQATGAKVE